MLESSAPPTVFAKFLNDEILGKWPAAFFPAERIRRIRLSHKARRQLATGEAGQIRTDGVLAAGLSLTDAVPSETSGMIYPLTRRTGRSAHTRGARKFKYGSTYSRRIGLNNQC